MTGVPLPAGYVHEAYAKALEHIGRPRRLVGSGGWVLERPIPATARHDAIGCYPLFCCTDWTALRADLDAIGPELVSLVVVTDPFAPVDEAALREAFGDLARPFKQHHVLDLRTPLDAVLDAHHRRNVRRGRAAVGVEPVREPGRFDADWLRLYALLAARHGIRGYADFPPESLRAHLRIPGAEAFAAVCDGEVVGLSIWVTQGRFAYYHLAAYSARGYESRAPYALFDAAIRHLAAAGFEWLDLGAAAGLADDPSNGLARFKRGWATVSRPTWLCGRVFDREAYAALVRSRGTGSAAFFPAYRAPDAP